MPIPGLSLPPGMFAGVKIPIYPEVVGALDYGGLATTMTVSTPSEAAEGDVLFMHIVLGAAAARTVSSGKGWEQVYSFVGPGNLRRVAGFIRVAPAAGALTTQSFSFSGNSYYAARCVCIRYVAIRSIASATATATAVSSGAMPSLSPSWGADHPTLWLAVATALGNTATPADFSGWTNYAYRESTSNSTAGVRHKLAYLAEVAASKTPPNYSGGSSVNWGLATLGVRGHFAPSPSVAVPSAFTSGQWSAAPAAAYNYFDLTISALPADNNGLIHSIEYRLDGGSWQPITGATSQSVYCPPGTYNIEIRSKNSAGYSSASDTKSVTVNADTGGGGK